MLFFNPAFIALVIGLVVFTLCTLKAFDWLIEKRYGQAEPPLPLRENQRLADLENRVLLLEEEGNWSPSLPPDADDYTVVVDPLSYHARAKAVGERELAELRERVAKYDATNTNKECPV